MDLQKPVWRCSMFWSCAQWSRKTLYAEINELFTKAKRNERLAEGCWNRLLWLFIKNLPHKWRHLQRIPTSAFDDGLQRNERTMHPVGAWSCLMYVHWPMARDVPCEESTQMQNLRNYWTFVAEILFYRYRLKIFIWSSETQSPPCM